MKILVLGASGMLGNSVIRSLTLNNRWDVHGTIRTSSIKEFFPELISSKFHVIDDVNNIDNIANLLNYLKPSIIINCVGIIKQLSNSNDPLILIPINSLLPHILAKLCDRIGARLVHISTDCVFSGLKGSYTESDIPDGNDLYGRTKLLGEISYPHTITLRTSIIGHELHNKNGLLEWFLSQEGACDGYTRAIFSGFPTIVFANIIRDFVITNTNLHGVYHVSSDPISKFDLLKLIAKTYKKRINIIPNDSVIIDRSLDSKKFRTDTGYVSPSWPDLVSQMHNFQRGQ